MYACKVQAVVERPGHTMKHFLRSRIALRGAVKLAMACLLVALLSTAQKSAHAQVSFTLDSLSPTFMAPATSSETYYIDGHYSGTAGAFETFVMSLGARDANLDFIGVRMADDLVTWLHDSNGVGNYSGHIMAIGVDSLQTPGIYKYLHTLSDAPLVGVTYLNQNGNEESILYDYQITIAPFSPPTSSTPEPGPISLLAGVSLTGCYWLKMRRSRNK